MIKDKMKSIKLIYGIIMTALLITVGACLIVSCVGIYRMGGSPFSRESVAAAFSKICVPVYIAIAWFFVGVVLMVIFPDEIIKPKAQRSLDVAYAKLAEKIDFTSGDERVLALTKAEKTRKIIKIAAIALSVVCVIVSCVITVLIVLDNEIALANKTVTKCALISLPLMLVAIGGGIASAHVIDRSYNKSIAMAKSIIADKSAQKAGKKEACDTKKSEKILLFVKLGIIAIGVILLVLGICGDGIKGTLEKAIRICTECIGLG